MKGINTKIKRKSANKVYVEVKDWQGKTREVSYEHALYGLVLGCAVKRSKNWHSLILITGEVGDGKSTLADGVAGLDKYINNSSYDLDNVVFSSTAFELLCDRLDNFNTPIKYDEAIEGATSQDMARSSKGLSFKKKMVTKRKKKHLYIMCIDELEEYSWKLVKMANAWIHVKANGLQRGYFDITTSKKKIKTKYLALKNKQYKLAESIMPDFPNCTFMNYEDIFISEDDYQKKKDEETSNKEEEGTGVKWSDDKVMSFFYKAKGYKHKEIAELTGVSINTIKSWSSGDFKKYMG